MDVQTRDSLKRAKEYLPPGYVIVPVTPTPGMEDQAAHNLCDEYGVEKVKGLRQFALDAYGEFINAGQVR